MSIDNCLFYTVAGPDVGLGHLKRCIAFANALRSKGIGSEFLLEGNSSDLKRLVSGEGYECHGLPMNSPCQNLSELLMARSKNEQTIIFDFSCRARILNRIETLQQIDVLQQSGRRCVALDGIKEHSLFAGDEGILDFLITPYVGEAPRVTNQLAGAKYFIFSSEYVSAARTKRKISKDARRLLVTFGGTDFCNLTERCLKALKLIPEKKSVQVIVGPGFSAKQTSTIQKLVEETDRHKIELIDSPASLHTQMVWCDIAVSNTGLTKYELAVTGTPSIQISIDESHSNTNSNFANAETANHIGISENTSADLIARSIETLCADVAERQRFSINGKNLFDGLGAERVINALFRNATNAATKDYVLC